MFLNKILIILIIFSFFFAGGCFFQTPGGEDLEELNMVLENKRVLMVVAQNGFQEIEYSEPRRILEEKGVEVKVASLQKGEARGAQTGKIIQVDFSTGEIDAKNFDAIVFIGGGGMIQLVNSSHFTELAKKFNDAGKIVSAICIAPMILANAGLLDGKKATVFPSARGDLENKGASYTGADVEIDGNIITGNGPEAVKEFGQTLVRILAK